MDYKTQVIQTQVDKDATLKVNGQNEDESVIY